MYTYASDQPFSTDVAFTNNPGGIIPHGQYVGVFSTSASTRPVYG